MTQSWNKGLTRAEIRMPITIRGQEFPSQYAAAKHFGVATSTIQQAIINDTVDNIGLRKMKRKEQK